MFIDRYTWIVYLWGTWIVYLWGAWSVYLRDMWIVNLFVRRAVFFICEAREFLIVRHVDCTRHVTLGDQWYYVEQFHIRLCFINFPSISDSSPAGSSRAREKTMPGCRIGPWPPPDPVRWLISRPSRPAAASHRLRIRSRSCDPNQLAPNVRLIKPSLLKPNQCSIHESAAVRQLTFDYIDSIRMRHTCDACGTQVTHTCFFWF